MDRDPFILRVQQEAGGKWQGFIIHGAGALVALTARAGAMSANDQPGETASFQKGQLEQIQGNPMRVLSYTVNGYKVETDNRKGSYKINGQPAHLHEPPYNQACS